MEDCIPVECSSTRIFDQDRSCFIFCLGCFGRHYFFPALLCSLLFWDYVGVVITLFVVFVVVAVVTLVAVALLVVVFVLGRSEDVACVPQ